MKYKFDHFKFQTKMRRLTLAVWKKYYSLKKKKPSELTEYDKFWMRNMRANLKINQIKLIGTHVPTQTQTEWTLKKDLVKEKINKKEYISKLLLKVQDKRKSSVVFTKETKTFAGANFTTVGGVFEKSASIVPLGQFLNTNNPLTPKYPRHKNKNYIGIELEFNALPGQEFSQGAIAQKLKDAGFARYVDVTTDASCGWEVRVLLLEDEFEPILKQILSVISGMGFKSNEQCGTHVHFDMRNRDVKIVYENLFKTQKFLRKFLTRNRKYNMYCKMNKADSFDKQLSLGDRRHSINVQAYNAHRTIEVRMHQGTLNPNELVPWIKLLSKIVNYSKTLDKSVNTLKQAKKQLDIENELVQNLEERILAVFKRTKVAAPDVAIPQPNDGTLRNWLGL